MRNKIHTQKESEKIIAIDKGKNGVQLTDVAMVLITAFLAYYTWQLFKTAITQTEQAIKMAQSAQVQDSIAKLVYSRDSLNNADTKVNDSLNRVMVKKRDSTIFAQQTASFNAQIKSIKESQNQFEVQNEPYLALTTPILKIDSIHKTVGIEASIKNLGNYPVQIYESVLMTSISENMPIFKDEIDDAFKGVIEDVHYDSSLRTPPSVQHYLTADMPLPLIPSKASEMAASILGFSDSFILGDMSLYWLGEFKYKNLITKKKKNMIS